MSILQRAESPELVSEPDPVLLTAASYTSCPDDSSEWSSNSDEGDEGDEVSSDSSARSDSSSERDGSDSHMQSKSSASSVSQPDRHVACMREQLLFRLSRKFLFHHRVYDRDDEMWVYRAQDLETGMVVAIKIRREDCRKKDPMEVRILSKLRDVRGCQRLLHYFRLEQCSVIVTPFYVNYDAVELLRGDDSGIREFMLQLMQVLARIHARGIVSRDIKLSNIMWDASLCELVLIDFDLSTFLTGAKAPLRRCVGTEGFEAPEIVEIENSEGLCPRGYDAKVDVYSAGVVFGQLLFSVDECSVDRRTIKNWLRLSRKSHRPAERLLVEMLQYDPVQRPSSAMVLDHDFFLDKPRAGELPWSRLFHAH